MIYAISGLSGSGKSTIARHLSNEVKMPLIVTCTTRPIRPNEKNGVDYHFLTNDEYEKLSTIANEKFLVANGETWKYGIIKEHLKNDCIIVLSPAGISKLKESFKVIDIMIEVEEKERINRILKRKDNQLKEEIKRRQLADKTTFETYSPQFVIRNNGKVKDTVELAKKIIKNTK